MARIRNISPKFFEDETLAKLTLGGRLLYIGIWTRCDLNGVFEWNIKVLTAALFPHDDGIDAATVEKWLQMLVELGRVTRFESEGKRYGFLPRFSDHQAISKAERDQDEKNRGLGRGCYPLPPMVSGTGSKTVLPTVPKTPDEGRGTNDEGRGTGDAARTPPPPPVNPSKIENRKRLATTLRRCGLQATEDRDGQAGTITEWGDLFMGRGKCSEPGQVYAGIAWVVKTSKTEGVTVRYAKDAAGYADRWGAMLDRRVAGMEGET
jgi:hypothetical protein